MSSRRPRCQQIGTSRTINDDQIADLTYKLQQLISHDQIHTTHSHHKGLDPKVLEETCSYIRSLKKDVEELSQRLSELLQSTDASTPQAAIIRSLLMSP